MFISNLFFQAFELAKSTKGLTSPNPAVGAVVVKNGAIVGQGATHPVGKDHAEWAAIQQAGKHCQGADMYVTLEPCVDYPGKNTPSCAKRILSAGISRVYIGTKDPNPNVYEKGIRLLKEGGVEVQLIDEYRQKLIELNEDYFKYIQSGIPFVYAKYAMTLDGNIANSAGDSKWITNEESRRRVHAFRNRVDAVMVGANTVLNDNPRLDVRLAEKLKDPLRIIIDPHGKTPEKFNVMSDEGKTLFIVSDKVSKNFTDTCNRHHKQFITFKYPFSFKEIMKYLGKELSIESILVEGGGKIHYQCFRENIIDKVFAFVAPKILGGIGIQPFNGETGLNMSAAPKLKDIYVENISDDILIRGYIHDENQWTKII